MAGLLFAANPSRLSPGEDPRVGWYCYRATQSRRSHLTYTPTERAHTDPKIYLLGKTDVHLMPRGAQVGDVALEP